MKNFVAVLMSGTTEEWFDTEEEAWDYIYSRSCEACKQSDSDACAAEWDVWTKEDYEDLT
jgi:hypothetical protein